jgi:hypothetical protein
MDPFNNIFGQSRGRVKPDLEDEVLKIINDRATKDDGGVAPDNIARSLDREQSQVEATLRTAESNLMIHRGPNGRWHPGRSTP